MVISEYLYKGTPKQTWGDLSKFRSMIVREESLAGFSQDCQFDRYIKLGKGEKKIRRSGPRYDSWRFVWSLFSAFALRSRCGSSQALCPIRSWFPRWKQGQFSQVIDYKTHVYTELFGSQGWRYQVVSLAPLMQRSFEVEVFVNGKP